MRIGLQLPSFTWPGGPARIAPRLADIARTAEQAGFYSLWVMDHFFQISMIGPPENDMLEAYTALGYLAASTRRLKLGTMVTGVIYRHPGMLVKTATTLDVLSGGRSYFALGAAWNEPEARGLGMPFPPLGVRFEMLEETLQIARQMWSSDDGPYRGKHNQLERTLCVPQPLSRPHPPILFGGPDTIRAKLDVLRQHCRTLGRDFATIEVTSLGTVDLQPGKMSANDVIGHCRSLAAAGVQHAVFNMPNVHELAPLETFGREIIPAVAGF